MTLKHRLFDCRETLPAFVLHSEYDTPEEMVEAWRRLMNDPKIASTMYLCPEIFWNREDYTKEEMLKFERKHIKQY